MRCAKLRQSTTQSYLPINGSVVTGKTIEPAVCATEELEETAKLFLLLRGNKFAIRDSGQVAELRTKWSS